MHIRITDEVGKVLIDKKLTGMPIRETAIIDATIKYYNDPYPCVIRRSAVMKIMFGQIEDILKSSCPGSPMSICDLSERFSYLIDLPKSAKYVSFRE